jgi:hypothetical protein
VLDINCIIPIVPATTKFPVRRYAIKKVADDPVTRQLMVFIKDLEYESAKTHFLAYLCSRYSMHSFVKNLLFYLITHISAISYINDVWN